MKKLFLFVAAICASAALNAATITLEPGENKIGDAIATLADGDVIELQTGTYTEWSTLEFSTKVTLKAAEGATPIVQPNVIKIKNDFEANGITFINLSKDNYLLRTGADVAGTIAIKNCNLELNAEVTGPVPYIYLSSNTIGNLVIDNCTFAPNAKTEGAIVYGLTTVNNFTMTNSTAVACGGTDLAVYMKTMTTATVDHCTFYNCGARVLYLPSNEAMTSCAVSNCIVANAALVDQYCVATYGGTVDNVLYYNTKAPRSSDATVNGCINEDPKFVDAANGDLTLGEGSPAIDAATDGTSLGDPRWFPAVVVPTVFNVTVPEGTDACYLVGSMNSWTIGEPIEMTKVDDTHYTYTADEDLTGAEYKYVHGADWAYVEKDAQGGEIGNRVVNAAEMEDEVAWWADWKILSEITENFFVNLETPEAVEEGVGFNYAEGVQTMTVNSTAWDPNGGVFYFDGYVKSTNLTAIKGTFKCAATDIWTEIYPYVIDEEGNRWYKVNFVAGQCTDWTNFDHRTFQTMFDGKTEEDWQNAKIVAFGFVASCGTPLENYVMELKDVEILVGEQTALNNVKARTKAVKAVRNGQIVIERNGVRYNILGAQF